jgi:isopenicillin N synthase-like dioxygenase
LNFLTIHGKSRFPGLNIWTKDGTKMLAKIPDGCLLIQAGKQMEYMTGGKVMAGFHEVVVVPSTLEVLSMPFIIFGSLQFYQLCSFCLRGHLFFFFFCQAIERQKQMNRPVWRISSTLFFHIASDNELKPIGPFSNPEADAKYPPLLTGIQVQRELGFIKLGGDE